MSASREFKMLELVVLVGLVSGVFLAELTNFLANSNISGPGWSLKGNGALWVPFGLGPAFLALGFSGLVLHYRKAAKWQRFAGITLGVGIAIAVVGLLVEILARSSRSETLYTFFSFLPWVFVILAPVVWGLIPMGKIDGERVSAVWYVVAGIVFAIVLVASFFVGGRVLP